MLLGQDQRALGALIVVKTEEAARYLESLSPSATSTVNSSINNINKSQVDDTIVSNQQTSCSVVSTTTSTSSAMPASVIPNDSKTTLNTSSTYTNPKDSEGIEDDHRLRAYIRNAIDTATTDLPYWQRVGSFKLVTEPFTVSNGLLTQTLKVCMGYLYFQSTYIYSKLIVY